MVQKGFRGEIYHATHRHVRAIKGYDTKVRKVKIQINNHHILGNGM